MTLGRPRRHLREAGSTNDVARGLAAAGAPHGTLVTAGVQTAGRGRQGRSWAAPAGRALLLSLVLREFDSLVSLRAGLAVADLAGPAARVKWPNDVELGGRKVAGVLVEGRPSEGWAVVGIGVNAAVDPDELPAALRDSAGGLGRGPEELENVLAELLLALALRFEQPAAAALEALSERDGLRGREVAWAAGRGIAAGIAEDGGLRVRREGGGVEVLHAGEVRLQAAGA